VASSESFTALQYLCSGPTMPRNKHSPTSRSSMIAVILSVHLDDSSRDQFKVNIVPRSPHPVPKPISALISLGSTMSTPTHKAEVKWFNSISLKECQPFLTPIVIIKKEIILEVDAHKVVVGRWAPNMDSRRSISSAVRTRRSIITRVQPVNTVTRLTRSSQWLRGNRVYLHRGGLHDAVKPTTRPTEES
jgi:hypothetical protein